MLDENWTPSDEYPAALYFHCPNTNCDGHVKLRDRSRHHAIRCEKCGLEFAIGAAPQLRKGGKAVVGVCVRLQWQGALGARTGPWPVGGNFDCLAISQIMLNLKPTM
jgi:hypothetical protein